MSPRQMTTVHKVSAEPVPAERAAPGARAPGLYGSSTDVRPGRVAAAELVGTYLLVLVGTGVATAATLHRASYDALAVGLAFGLALVALVAALGHVSGCHLNPAVTVGLAATGRFPWRLAPVYLAAQLAGAVLASLTVWAAFADAARSGASLAAPSPGTLGVARTGLVELVVTFLLVLVVVSVATDERAEGSVAGVAVGFALGVAVLFGGPLTGGGVNPARALGPMIVAWHGPQWGTYLLAPLVGGVLAALLYDRVISGTDAPA